MPDKDKDVVANTGDGPHTDDVDAQHDVVAVPSLDKTGAPDQEPGFEVLVDDRSGERSDTRTRETTSRRSSGAGKSDTETR